MKISRMNKYDADSKTKAFFDMETEEGIVVKGFSLVEGGSGLFVSVPSHKGKDEKYYENVLMSKEQKKELNDLALSQYDEL